MKAKPPCEILADLARELAEWLPPECGLKASLFEAARYWAGEEGAVLDLSLSGQSGGEVFDRAVDCVRFGRKDLAAARISAILRSKERRPILRLRRNVLRPAPNLPQPDPRKSFDNGHVPRTGKE